jgi:UDPglucose 6-dehydrogenase
MKIAVIGTGYVGLTTGVCFAETGNYVICVDKDAKKLENLRRGCIPIYEPGLEPLFHRAVEQRRLAFTDDIGSAVEQAEIIFLALPTPEDEDGSADLSHVLEVSEKLAQIIKSKKVIVTKSTVPVGTASKIKEILQRYQCPAVVVSNPEFLREGFAVEDFMKPDRIVIGSSDTEARALLAQLYKPFVRQGNPIYFMSEESAELTKYASNAFLAMKISFMNEMARLAEKTGANIDDIRLAMGADNRIGRRFLFAGLGFGGSCFPKDVKALAYMGRLHGLTMKLAEATLEVNASQLVFFQNKILRHFNSHLKGLRFAIWGLSFKPDTDDVREAPALKLIRWLWTQGASVAAFDPEGFENAQRLLPELPPMKGLYETLEGADALLICTEWSLFRSPEFELMKEKMAKPIIFDGRNIYDPQETRLLGFTYYSIGRP